MAKDADYRRLINTARWQRLRRDKLTAHPLCERCAADGRVAAATEVHHVVPVETALTAREKARLMYDAANLRALCHECHVLTHKEMGRSGRDATRQRNAMHTEQAVRKLYGGGGAGIDATPGVFF